MPKTSTRTNFPATRVAVAVLVAALSACATTVARAQTPGEGAATEVAASPTTSTLPAAPSLPPVQVAAPAATSTCDTAGFKRIAEESRRGTVRITTHTHWGAGFLIDDTHVVTHVSIVDRPLHLRVHARDGISIGAKIVFVDAFERLAILELDAPIAGKALELAPSAPIVGSDVVSIGVPLDFGAREEPFAAHRRGHISDVNDDLMITDAPFVGNHHMGGPLLDCQGHVVGIVIPAPSGRAAWESPMVYAVPVGKIREARANMGKKPYQNKPSFVLGFQSAFATQFERGRGYVGGTLGIPILFFEQWEFMPRFGAYAQVPANSDSKLPLGRTDRGRFTGDVRIGYRIPLVSAPATVSLVPSIGAGWNWDLTQAKTYSLTLDDPMCTNQTGPCSFRMVEKENESWQQSEAFFVGLGVHVSAATLGYELRIMPSADVKFIHQISLGVATF